MEIIRNSINFHILLGVIIFSFLGCEKNHDNENEECKEFSVSLMKTDDYVSFDKTVILFENEIYLAKTPLNFFLSDLDHLFVVDYDRYLSTLEKIASYGQSHDTLYVSSYFNPSSLDFVLADFLESGHCYLYDKINNKVIEQIIVKYWGCNPQPLSGVGGRRFYINNKLFLETTDWISKK